MSYYGISQTANDGVRFLSGIAVPTPIFGKAPQARAMVGWTRPGDSFSRLDVLNTDAVRLNANMIAFISPGPLMSGWSAWFTEFDRLYQTFAGPHASKLQQANVITHSDEFAQRVTTEEEQYRSFLAEYNNQRLSNGQPVPQLVPRIPGPPQAFGWTIPWWAWMLGGVAVVGVGYLGYLQYIKTRNTRRAIDKELPRLLDSLLPKGGHSLGKVVAETSPARDFDRDMSYDYDDAGSYAEGDAAEYDSDAPDFKPFKLDSYAGKRDL